MDKPSRPLQILNVVTAVAVLASLYLVFFVAPREQVMGEVQRIFYWHVPAAWMSMVAFGITALTGVIYLVTRRRAWDMISRSSVEVGLLFTLITIVSGSVWARPAWNTWWTWDPRLTTYTIVALIYVAYVMLRQGIEDPERAARFAAVYGLVGFVSVPITFFSIRWWRTIHPVVIGTPSAAAEGSFAMTDSMLFIFLLCNLVFPLLYAALLANRVRLERLYERVERAKARVAAPEGDIYAPGAAAARHAEYR